MPISEFDRSLFDEILFGEAPVTQTGPLTELLIGGADRLCQVLVADFGLSLEINGAISTLSFSLLDDAGGTAVQVGNTAILDSVDGRLFSGYVSRLEPVKLNQEKIVWKAQCQDHTRILEAAMTGVETFTAATDKIMIQYLFDKYLPSVDVSTYVSEIVSIASLDLSYRNLRQCMETISGLTQGVWYLDANLKLHYFAQGARSAPFGLTEGEGGERMLVSAGPSYTMDFTAPVNKCTVRNIYEEQSTQANYNPPAGTDDGDASKTSAAWPPTGTVTVDTASASFIAQRRLLNTEQQTELQYPATASGDDGWVGKSGTAYPPGGDVWISTDDTWASAKRAKDGATYIIRCAVARFDTSAIPDNAEIVSAKLVLNVLGSNQGDAYSYFTLEWYDAGNWPIDAGDYTATPSNSAGWAALQGIGTGVKEFTLSAPNAYVNKTGYTGLRMHIETPGTPSGNNYVEFSTIEGGSAPYLSVTYKTGGVEYTISCALVRFDTAALPDTAIISGATLKLKIATKVNADAAQIGIEWYAGANWPIDAADYTATPANTAWGYTNLSALPAVGQWLNVPLSSPNANISKTGYTGFRIHVKTTATPTGDNAVSFASQESADDPILEVVYVPGAMIVGTKEDTDSQTAYGLFEKQIVNPRILTQAEAEQQAESEVVKGAWPQYAFGTAILAHGLAVGQLVHVIFPSLGIDKDFLIRRLRIAGFAPGKLLYTVDCGNFRDDLIRHLRIVALRAAGVSA